MQNFNNNSSLPHNRHLCASPISTKSGSLDGSKHRSRRRLGRSGVHEPASPSVSNRNRGMDVRGIIAPSSRDQQLMRQVSGLDFDDFDGGDVADAAVEEGGGLEIRGSEIAGTIAPSRRQRQLMRQISGLGLEDPVFGKTLDFDDSIAKEHASFIFDDMDINDIPEDMRDMVSQASDRTDVVESDDGRSYDSKSYASMLGLEPGAESPLPIPGARKKKLRKGKKPRRKSRDMSTAQSITSDPNYVPPAPVFETKSRKKGHNKVERRGSNNTDCRNSVGSIAGSIDKYIENGVEQKIAETVDAILNMNASKAGSSHSRSSFTGHSRTSQFGQRRGNRTKPLRVDSRITVSSNTYVPPGLQADGLSQRGERNMPDMDQIFDERKHRKKNRKLIEEKKKKKKSKSKPSRTRSHRSHKEPD
eukprot:CAMPEP_0197192060 /NCGR_PEP_ID=MMETSP1423-20130617/24451_1 /TAXON_ID=476441 /ORGANISM="Pseudo-nitzschia heimii, Strain UNC1101" /LENGTH=416 /DNA_ID=CAMNT_0042644873 /DNA_START=258 /DNA_END=1508 /DNA_ORIENTATION=-